MQRAGVREYMAAARINCAIDMFRLVIKCKSITVYMRMAPYTGCHRFAGMAGSQRRIAVALGTVTRTGCAGRAAAAQCRGGREACPPNRCCSYRVILGDEGRIAAMTPGGGTGGRGR